MKKLKLAGLLIASIGVSAAVQPAYASNSLNSTTANTIILEDSALMSAIKANPSNAEALIADAIISAGPESSETLNILNEAIQAGVDVDTVTTVAIASGVDATIASEATAGFFKNLRERRQQIRKNLRMRIKNFVGGCGAGISPNC